MADETYTDAPVTVTLKAGAGYEAPWIVLRGTADEVGQDLQGILEADQEADTFVQLVSEAAALLHGVYTVAKGAAKGNDDTPPWKGEEQSSRTSSRGRGSFSGRSSSGRGTSGKTRSTSSDGEQSVSRDSLDCEHGEANRVVSKKWIGYFCPEKVKSRQCKPAFFDHDDDPEA